MRFTFESVSSTDHRGIPDEHLQAEAKCSVAYLPELWAGIIAMCTQT